MKNIESKEGFSDYTCQLTNETRKLINKFFPIKEEIELNPLEKSSEKLIHILVRHCLIFILSEMNLEERQNLQKQNLNL